MKNELSMNKTFGIAWLHAAAKLAFAIAAVNLGTWASFAEAAKDGPQFRYMRFPHRDVRINLTESRIAPYTLEDPLEFADGRKVETAEDWSERRAEILGIFEREMYGKHPPAPGAEDARDGPR